MYPRTMFYAQENIYDEFASKFGMKVKAFSVGHGFEDGVNQGPLINKVYILYAPIMLVPRLHWNL